MKLTEKERLMLRVQLNTANMIALLSAISEKVPEHINNDAREVISKLQADTKEIYDKLAN